MSAETSEPDNNLLLIAGFYGGLRFENSTSKVLFKPVDVNEVPGLQVYLGLTVLSVYF